MAPDPAGEYMALVVRLQADPDGGWRLHVDGTLQPMSPPLVPGTFVIRLWRASDSGMVRGTIRLESDDNWAPFQSNAQLIQLIHTWLFGGSSANIE